MPDRRAHAIVFLGALAIAIGAGLLRYPEPDSELSGSLPAQVAESDFATSATCQACHPAEYGTWHRSYHRTMTQAATPEAVLGDFDEVLLENRGFEWRLERRGREFWVRMPDPVWFEQPYWLMQALDPAWPDTPPMMEARVVMTTGSHHMQNYWTRRPGADEGSLGPDTGALLQLPWVWLIDESRWVPNQDSFIAPASGSLGGIATWNANCSQCHSVATEPRTSEGYDEFETRSVELGIACEACHGPGERHVSNYQSPVRRYLRYVRDLTGDAPDPTIVNPEKLEQRRSAEVCGQCHSFGAWRDEEGYRSQGIPFRPGQELDEHRSVFRYTQFRQDAQLREILEADPAALESRFWADGTIRVTGREYNGLLEDVHFTESELTCLTCHSMHEYDAPDVQLHSGTSGDESCLGCHGDYADDVSAHTRHEVGSSGSQCMNCHMPHTTYGLFSAIRSHRIDSPNVLTSVYGGRPNACNLCHLDQTLEWSGRYLSEWYGQAQVPMDQDERSIAAAVLWTLKGDAAQRTVLAWHMGWRPAREASGDGWLAPYLAQLLTDSYSATRQVAFRSISRLPGFQGFEYDYVASPAELGSKADEALRRWVGVGGGRATGSHLLIGDDGRVDPDEWRRLLAERNQTPLTIRE